MTAWLLCLSLLTSLNFVISCPITQQFNSLDEFYEFGENNPNVASNEPLYRVWLDEGYNIDGAACLDGTMPAFYFRKGIGSGINKFQR